MKPFTSWKAYDLKGMGHNSPEYLHTLVEALKLAFADRDSYYGDPDFVDVPLEGLLSKAYAAGRRDAIDPDLACAGMPLPGGPWPYQGVEDQEAKGTSPVTMAGGLEADTSYVCVVDRWGKCLLSHPQRLHWWNAFGQGIGLRHLPSRFPELARSGSPLRRGSRQAPKTHPQPGHGL